MAVPQAPPWVSDYLAELTRRLRTSLGPDLVAVYVAGSLVLDDFDPVRSDVDLTAVLADDVPRDVRTTALERGRHSALPCPVRGLELVGYPLATVTTATAAPGF